MALNMLGGQYVEEGIPADAVPLLKQSVEAFHELGDDSLELTATSNLAWACAELGDRDSARAQQEAVLTRATRLHHDRMVAHSLFELAAMSIDDGRLDDASSMLAQSLRIFGDRKELLWVAIDLSFVAAVLALKGRWSSAAVTLASAQALRDEIGTTFEWLGARDEATLAIVEAHLGEAALALGRSRGKSLAPDEAVELALTALDEQRRDA